VGKPEVVQLILKAEIDKCYQNNQQLSNKYSHEYINNNNGIDIKHLLSTETALDTADARERAITSTLPYFPLDYDFIVLISEVLSCQIDRLLEIVNGQIDE